MECRDVPATDEGFCYLAVILRNQTTSSISETGKFAPPQTIESILGALMPESVLREFETWFPQRPKLEAMLIPYFLDVIVRINMEPERGDNRYQYALATEGRCLQKHKTDNPFGFIKGEPIAKRDLYTHDELLKHWKEIFELDERIENYGALRDSYAPRCKHGHVATPAVIVTTQHQLRIVDKTGNYVRGTNISFCRTKSGVGQLFKMAEYLTNLRADGTPRESIDDYLAALSREPDTNKTWIKAMRVIRDASKTVHTKLENILMLKGYTGEEAEELRRVLEKDPDVGGFVIGRTDLEFLPESVPEDMKERRFGELWLPYNENKICWHVYHDRDYTRIEGDRRTKHIEYKTKKERKILEGFTPWHWAIMRRLAPYFIDRYMLDAFNTIYEPYLSLERFKKPNHLAPSSP